MYLVMKFHRWDALQDDASWPGPPIRVLNEQSDGMIGFLTVFATYEQALAWSDGWPEKVVEIREDGAPSAAPEDQPDSGPVERREDHDSEHGPR